MDMDEIAQLLNDGESSEALKELRKLHGLVNRFVCPECGLARDSCTGFRCERCGAIMSVRVVVVEDEPPTRPAGMTLTCDDCGAKYCQHRGDLYNTNGDCLAEK